MPHVLVYVSERRTHLPTLCFDEGLNLLVLSDTVRHNLVEVRIAHFKTECIYFLSYMYAGAC